MELSCQDHTPAAERHPLVKLVYSAITSLDGYVADEDGNFDWAAPSEEVHAFINDLERPVGTYLYGRRLYETMVVWESLDLSGQPPVVVDFAQAVAGGRQDRLLEDSGDGRQHADAARAGVRPRGGPADEGGEPSADITVGGPDLAAQAIRAGLVDECHFFVTPVVIGGGTRSLPGNVRLKLELLDERRFGSGVVHLHYGMVT